MNYRITPPPISELAALASNIQTERTAADKVSMAISIWEAAQKTLDQFAHVQNQIKESKIRNHDEKISKLDLHEGIKLSEFLKRLFPSSKPEDTMKWYREYLTASFSFVYSEMSEKQIEDLIPATLERERSEGMTFPNFCAVGFLKYREKQSAAVRKEKASTAAKSKKTTNGKKTIRTQKNAPKTAQAKKKKP